jgi:medium-chain acyl-[acyl-carrier-protein] hydrolase
VRIVPSANDVATCGKPNPDARLRLYCFPFAGAGTWAYTSWVDELPTDIQRETELWSVNLPGRKSGRNESPFTALPPLIEALTPAVGPHLKAPYAFFGHSMGALVGFELACRLRTQGRAGPVHMIVSGHRAPQLPDRHPPVHRLRDPEILAKLRALGGTPEDVMRNPELIKLFLPLVRADLTVCETYAYEHREPLDCSVTAFGGNDDPEVSREELSAWRRRTRESFSLHMFPGGHFFLQSAQSLVLRVLAQDLRQVLRRIK